MDWLLSFLVVFNNFWISRKRRWAWYVAYVTSLLWVVYAFKINQPGLIPSAIINAAVCIGALRSWRKGQ